MKNMMQPLLSPNDGAGSGPGMKELDQAIAVLGQINILIPVAYGLGKTLASLVKEAVTSGDPKTVEEARAAVAKFDAISAEVRQTAETWLDTHPRQPE